MSEKEHDKRPNLLATLGRNDAIMLLLLHFSGVCVHVRTGREFHTVQCQLFTQEEEEEEEEEENLSIYVPHRSIPFPSIIVTRMPVDFI